MLSKILTKIIGLCDKHWVRCGQDFFYLCYHYHHRHHCYHHYHCIILNIEKIENKILLLYQAQVILEIELRLVLFCLLKVKFELKGIG